MSGIGTLEYLDVEVTSPYSHTHPANGRCEQCFGFAPEAAVRGCVSSCGDGFAPETAVRGCSSCGGFAPEATVRRCIPTQCIPSSCIGVAPESAVRRCIPTQCIPSTCEGVAPESALRRCITNCEQPGAEPVLDSGVRGCGEPTGRAVDSGVRGCGEPVHRAVDSGVRGCGEPAVAAGVRRCIPTQCIPSTCDNPPVEPLAEVDTPRRCDTWVRRCGTMAKPGDGVEGYSEVPGPDGTAGA